MNIRKTDHAQRRLSLQTGAARTRRQAGKQAGIVMFIALISLVLLTIGATALMRTFGPSASVAGNIAFKQAATQVADVGVELAYAYLQANPGRQIDDSLMYYALLQPSDLSGMPLVGSAVQPIDWRMLPCYGADRQVTNCNDDSAYRLQYVIDRQCTRVPLTSEDVPLYCIVLPADTKGSLKDDSPQFTPVYRVVYRVTVRVSGPRNTSSVVQASLAF